MPSATLGTAGRADLYWCRSPPRLITLADFDPSKGWAVEDGGVGVKVTCFVKLLLEDHGDSSVPHLHERRQLLCAAAQRVRRRTAIRSRLCNWHQPDVGGYTCLERGEGRGVMTSTYQAPCPSWWVTGGGRSCRCLSRGNHSLQRYWNKKRLCGKIQLRVSESLYVSLKVNCCPNFVSSDNIFFLSNAAVFLVLPTRSLNRRLLKISCCNNCLQCREYFMYCPLVAHKLVLQIFRL